MTDWMPEDVPLCEACGRVPADEHTSAGELCRGCIVTDRW